MQSFATEINLFITAMFTGMRQGELLGLAWECVNFESGIITVKQQLQCKDGTYFFETPKSGKKRTILPAPIAMDALHNELQKQKREQLEAGNMWNNQYNLVFTDALGKNLVRRTVERSIKLKRIKCCICHKSIFVQDGNNPWPIRPRSEMGTEENRCCHSCDKDIVSPVRRLLIRGSEEWPQQYHEKFMEMDYQQINAWIKEHLWPALDKR